jgi:hypothetical protein
MSNEVVSQGGSLIPPVPPPRRRWRLIVLFLCIFICGGLIGPVVIHFIIGLHGYPPGFGGHGPGNIEERAHDVVSRMRNDLDLTEKQAEQIYTITKERFTALEDVLHQNFDAMDLEIRTVLNDKQITKFDEWMNKRRESFPPPGKNMRRENK